MALMNFSLGDIGNVLVRAREALFGEKITDPTELAKIDLQLAQLQSAVNTGQIEINKIEAAHKSLFVAGWRPFIGWVCGVSIAYAFVGQPILEWFVAVADIQHTYTVVAADGTTSEITRLIETPVIDSDTLYQLVLAMLGMAGLRTYEKGKAVAREK